MTQHCIVLGDGRRVGVAAYCAAVRKAKANPCAHFNRTFEDRWGGPGAEIVRQFVKGVHDRINHGDPAYGVGRKWSPDWQRAMRQAANFLNVPRLIIDWLPPDLEARFAHRLRRNMEL